MQKRKNNKRKVNVDRKKLHQLAKEAHLTGDILDSIAAGVCVNSFDRLNS